MTSGVESAQSQAGGGNLSVLMLGTADWNQPIATNQHYVAREICRASGVSVSFVESLGLRRPQLSRRDLTRMVHRLVSSIRREHDVSGHSWRVQPVELTVCSPLVIPIHRGPLSYPNRYLLQSKVRDWMSDSSSRILWTYTPVTYELENYADAVVYHCVDLLGTFPGIDPQVIDIAERSLAEVGAIGIATSAVVKEHLESVGFHDVLLWENVADTEPIVAADPFGATRVSGRVIFGGNLSPRKLDYPLLAALADAGLDVRLAGPRAQGGGRDNDEFDALMAKGITYLGMLSLPQLAEELVTSCVGIIPYALNDYTRGVSPLKTYEYLAAGLSVVSTGVPGVDGTLRGIWVEETKGAFVARCVAQASAPAAGQITERVALAAQHSWRVRGQQVRDLLAKVAIV